MKYRLKGYLFVNEKSLECRFDAILPSFDDIVEFLSRVSLEAYDRVTIFPDDYKDKEI